MVFVVNLVKLLIYKNHPFTLVGIYLNQIRNQIQAIFPIPNLQPNTMHLGHPMIFSHRDKNKLYYFTYNKDNRLGYLDHQFLGTINSNHLHQGTTFCMLLSTDGQSSQPCSCCFSHPCTKHQSLQLLVRLLATCSLYEQQGHNQTA
jgi:hypothetical protein